MIAGGAVSVPLLHLNRRVATRHAQHHDFAGALLITLAERPAPA